MSKKLTREEAIQLNTVLMGLQTQIGVVFTGLMQYEDRSEGYKLTLKLMKILDAVQTHQKVWEQTQKNRPDKKEKDFEELVKKREERIEKFLQEEVVLGTDEVFTIAELNDLWHPDDAKKKPEDATKEGRKRFTPQQIMYLKPVLKL